MGMMDRLRAVGIKTGVLVDRKGSGTPLVVIPGNSNAALARVTWLAFGVAVLMALLSAVVATQWVAQRFDYGQGLGSPVLGTWYWPWSIWVWTWHFNREEYGAFVLQTLGLGNAIVIGGAIAGFVMGLMIVWAKSRSLRKQRNDLHGSAHWANEDEIKQSGLLPDETNRGGVMLGAVEVDGKTQYLRHKGPEHVLVFAPTRSGKGVGIVLPTLYSWDESVLVHDIKGEAWALTSGFRERALGQRCLRFSPSQMASARFNPLEEIRRDENFIKDIQNVATIIVDPEGKGMADHWAKTGFDLMTGVIIYVLLKDGMDGKRNLGTVQAILSDGGVVREEAEQRQRNSVADDPKQGFAAVMELVKDEGLAHANNPQLPAYARVGWQTAAQAAQSYLNKAPNEASGVLSTALSFLSLYRDPIVEANTAVSDFTIESLMQQKSALYLVVPPSDKDRLKPLLRLIINQVVRRLTESMDFTPSGASKSRYPHRLLLLIDEFPALGKLDVFQEALAFIAGYGLKAVLIVQDLSQLNAAYTRDESIISNCHIRIAYAPNKVETAELLSKMAGTSTVQTTSRSYSGSRLSVLLNNVSTSDQLNQRPLLTADECMRLPASDELVFVAGQAPIYGQKILYFRDPQFVERQSMGWALDCGRPGLVLVCLPGPPQTFTYVPMEDSSRPEYRPTTLSETGVVIALTEEISDAADEGEKPSQSGGAIQGEKRGGKGRLKLVI